jgi:peptide/nickel transport system permease protein
MKPRRKLFWALLSLGSIHVLIILAGFVAPYGYATQDRMHAYTRPMRPHFKDCAGNFHLRPFVYLPQGDGGNLTNQVPDCKQRAPILFFVSGEPYTVLGVFHADRHLFGVQPPGRLFLLGSDGFGRDQFTRLLYGGQISLFAGLLAAVLTLAAALMIGAIAGLYGGLVDDAAMRLAELAIAVPSFYLLVAIRSLLPLELHALAAFLLVVSVIGLLSWPRPARLVRGVVLSARERNFVLAARGFGASNGYLLRRHLMPMTFGVALTQMAVLIPQFILAEVVLSFVGLGVGEPFPSWGNMLAQAQAYHVLVSSWWMLLPGAALVPVILAYHGLADALKDKLKSEV